ncbi:transporter substrate-binding domain-containing protein [Gilvimarinus agarilyticus]|uniref:transporter substrate-binding domain-containing protein n=1 Tax=Gilvimarinus agarilyticus TaxID=679259 RepID=UPI0006965D2F|nr:transporter substrate-binding domain-containing protein [Gilvimarinus agarilyticus]
MIFRCNQILKILLALVLGQSGWSVAEPGDQDVRVVLGTNTPSAYGAEKTPNSLGHSADLVRCVIAQLPYELSLHVQPWRRVQQEVLTGASDGFFTAMSDPQVDQYARLTDPLVLEKWYWFTRSDTTAADPRRLRTGTILGSQQQLWYQLNGYSSALSAQDLPQLIKLLLAKRIDVILADREHFTEAANALGVAAERYQSHFFRYVPLGVYLGLDFLAENKGFIERFNQKIPQCVPEGFALSPHEETLIRERIEPMVNQWRESPVLLTTLATYNQQRVELTDSHIQQADLQWRQAYQKADTDTLDAMLAPELMGDLPGWGENDRLGYVSEIIVTGARGLNLAVAPYSSDYWQGDEAKFRRTMSLPSGQWFFSEVVFDSSSRHFQVQVSLPLLLEGERAGVLTVGVDIERVLHAADGQP